MPDSGSGRSHKEHKWSDAENLPELEKLVFDTWSAISEKYMNMKKYAFWSPVHLRLTILVRASFLKHELHKSPNIAPASQVRASSQCHISQPRHRDHLQQTSETEVTQMRLTAFTVLSGR